MENTENQVTVINVSKFPTLKEVEREYFNLVLGKTNGNKTEAAKILGVTIKTIYNKLDAYSQNTTVLNAQE